MILKHIIKSIIIYHSLGPDVEDPVISDIPDTVLRNTDVGKPYAIVNWTIPSARDNSQSVTLTADYNPGDYFPIGDTEVTYIAIDQFGNNATAVIHVIVMGKYLVL